MNSGVGSELFLTLDPILARRSEFGRLSYSVEQDFTVYRRVYTEIVF